MLIRTPAYHEDTKIMKFHEDLCVFVIDGHFGSPRLHLKAAFYLEGNATGSVKAPTNSRCHHRPLARRSSGVVNVYL